MISTRSAGICTENTLASRGWHLAEVGDEEESGALGAISSAWDAVTDLGSQYSHSLGQDVFRHFRTRARMTVEGKGLAMEGSKLKRL